MKPLQFIAERAVPLRLDSAVEIGSPPAGEQPEYAEFGQYEDVLGAEDRARRVEGPYREPWLNVLRAFEPGTPPALEQLLQDPAHGAMVGGRVLDLGAGTGWATARLSRCEAVSEVTAVDLSPQFLDIVTRRVITALDCRPEKIGPVASDFRRIPRPDASYDTAFLIAALHHSLAPILLLREIRRVLKPEGCLFVIESPALWFQLRQKRRQALEEWTRSGATEITYTREEFRYLLQCGGFTRITVVPVQTVEESSRRHRRVLRRLARAARIEHLLSPPTLYFVARPARHTAATAF